MVAQAIREATSGQPGPVMPELPIDVLFSQVPEDSVAIPVTITADTAPAPSTAVVARALDILQSAERPVMVAGGGALFSGCQKELIAFAEMTGIPVLTNNKARGVMPTDHPLSGHGVANLAVARATGLGVPDVALFLGARFGLFTEPGLFSPERVPDDSTRIIQVDISGREFGRNRPVELPILADVRETLAALCEGGRTRDWPDRQAWAQGINQAASWHTMAFIDAIERTQGVHPYEALTEVMGVIDEDTIVCADGGEAAIWAEYVSRAKHPGQYMGHGYLGCLGIGLSFAVGAQVAHPDRRVVCVTGDGAAGFNIQEFDTMVRHKLPIVTVILNNKAWGMCVHGQQSMYGGNRLVATVLGESRYDRVVEGFGGHGELVESAGEVAQAMLRALDSGLPACVNILTDLDASTSDKTEMTPDSEIEIPYYANLKK